MGAREAVVMGFTGGTLSCISGSLYGTDVPVEMQQ